MYQNAFQFVYFYLWLDLQQLLNIRFLLQKAFSKKELRAHAGTPKSSPKGILKQLAVLNDVKVLSHNQDLEWTLCGK